MNPTSTLKTTLALALAAPALFAAPDASLIGGMLNVMVPAKHVGARLLLVWDDADKGDNPANWANSHEVAAAVPAADTRYAVDLLSLGITNGQLCRLVTTDQYRMLDKLKMPNNKAYIDTGIKDSDCYGVYFGFYGNESLGNNNAFCTFIGTQESGGGFAVGMANTSYDYWYWYYHDKDYNLGGSRPRVSSTSINNVSFANQTFTLNGSNVKSGLPAGAVGASGKNMFLGTWAAKDRFLYGWWSYVRFDDNNGDALLDYIPVKRYGDDAVGFYDRATGKFVLSTGGGAFTAGTVTNDLFSVAASAQAFSPTNLVGLDVQGSRVRVSVPPFYAGESLMVVWDDTDKGDDPAAWAHSSQIVDVIPSGGGTYTIRLSPLGVADRQVCGVFVEHRLRLLDKLKMTSKQTYVNTGIKDSEVYGVHFGFYGNECATDVNEGKFANFIGTTDAGFSMGMDSEAFNRWYWCYRGGKYYPRPSVRTDSINEVAFTNQTFTLNGSVVTPTSPNTALPVGAVGETGQNILVGTMDQATRFLYGWWSYVRFDDADGNAILDYIPTQRIADNAAGFYDRATGKFVLSTGGGAFTAGTVTNALTTIVHSRQTFVKIDIPTTICVR